MLTNTMAKEKTEEWVGTFGDQLYSWAYYKTSSKQTAEDLVQETFISAFTSFDKCQNPEKPKTWLFSILNNKIIDYYRKGARETKLIDRGYEEERIADVEALFDTGGRWTNTNTWTVEEAELLDRPEFNTLMESCVANLPEKWRVAVLSKFILNKKGEDVCKELDITPSNYWQLIHRSKLMLKECLQKYWR